MNFITPIHIVARDEQSILGCRIQNAGAYAFFNEPSLDVHHTLATKPLMGNGRQWLDNEAILKTIGYIDRRFGPVTRKFGKDGHPIPELGHFMWVAHKNYNNADLNKKLRKAGIDPVLAAFVGLCHDVVESLAGLAKKNGRLVDFDRHEAFVELLRLWPVPIHHKMLQAVIEVYITDADFMLTGDARINAQAAKNVNPNNDHIQEALNVATRCGDKRYNTGLDAYLRRCFVKALKQGKVNTNMPVERQRLWGLPDADVALAAKQAQTKRFAVLLPGVSEEDRKLYDQDTYYLTAEAKRVEHKLYAASTVFRRGVNIMATIGRRATYIPLKLAKAAACL